MTPPADKASTGGDWLIFSEFSEKNVPVPLPRPLAIEPLPQQMQRRLPPGAGDRRGQRDFFGADRDAVLCVAADLNSTGSH